jgi:AraC-like DNA-binding protein/quercetin dioxygenase-like cupin family protein
MASKSEDAFAPPSGTRPSDREPWSVVRELSTRGGRYIETSVLPSGPHPPHTHETPAIGLLLHGAIDVSYASGRRLAGDATTRAGALVLPVGSAHRARAGSDGARVLLLALEPERVASMDSAVSAMLAQPGWLRAPRLDALGRGLRRELAVADDAATLALEGLTLELLSALVRRSRGSAQPGPPPAWLRRARETLDDRYHERALRISDLADDAGVDPAYLARTFRAHYGTTAGTYLREVRVRRAADALSRSSAGLSQIALDTGFADQSHFTRVFNAAYGLTPRRWRELHRK